MTDATWITLISLGVTFLFMLGVPVFLVIGYWVVGCSFVLGMTLDNVGAALSDVFTDGFALLAMPLFILTGDLINKSGIARRLSNFAYACLGWLRGGLAMASIGACGLFAAISGSNSATTATIGSMLHPEMVKGGYDERFSAATAAAGGTVGIIIPPSIIFIVYGFLMNLPISDLFVAGIIPGAMMVIGMQLACWIICRVNGWGHLIPLQLSRVLKTAFGAWLGFFAIGLVLWGIYTGKFSPTEAAGVTVGFCIIVGLICLPLHRMLGTGNGERPVAERSYGEMLVVEGFKITEIPAITMRSAQITGILAPLIAISVVMQQILSLLGAQQVIGDFVTGMGGYYAVLFTAMVIVFVSGMILESLPVTIILAPILAPIAHSVGVDPIHFSVIFLVGASIGFVTPPYGLNLYVASGVTGVPYFRLLRFTLAYLAALITVWIVVALTPELATLLLPAREPEETVKTKRPEGGLVTIVEPEQKSDTIPTNLRLLLILEEIAQVGVPVTPTEVNGRIGLPKPTIHRLFATLEAEGFLQRELDGRSYTPGRRLRKLSTNVLSSLRVRTARLAVLNALAEEIGETCNIAVPDRDAMIYLDRVETKWPLRIQLPVGTHVPFYCTASGKMYLSTLNAAHLQRYLGAASLEARTGRTITDRTRLSEEIERTRARGYSQDNEEFMEGMIALAVPIRDDQGRLLSTLSFHAPTQRLTLDRAYAHLDRLHRAASELSQLVIEDV